MLSLSCVLIPLAIFFTSSNLVYSSCSSGDYYDQLSETIECSRYNPLTNYSCEGKLQSNGFTQSNVTVIKLHRSVYNVSNTTSYNSSVIQVCDGQEVENLQFFEGKRFCDTKIDMQENQITLENCDGETINPNGSGIIIRNFSSSNCTFVYIIEYINCTLYCAMNESNSTEDLEGEGSGDADDSWWYECSQNVKNVSAVLAVPYRECQRQKCLKFFERACSLCPKNCSEDHFYNDFISSRCPSHLLSNCTSLEGDQENNCQTNCQSLCLDCEGRNRSFCEAVCNNPFSNMSSSDMEMSFPSNDYEISETKKFCANQIQENCFNLTLLEINCGNSSEECTQICRQIGVVGFFAQGCPSEVYHFCDIYISDLLNSTPTLTEELFVTYVDVVSAFIVEVPPAELVDHLEDLLEELIEETFIELLINDGNVELLADVYDALFDDTISNNWTNDSGPMGPESIALRQMESLGELVSTGILEGNRSSPFKFEGDNLFFSVKAPKRSKAIDNDHRVIIQGESNLNDFSAEVRIPINVLCERSDKEKCSSVVAVSVVNNLAGYLHEALIRNQSDNRNSEYAQYVPATEILSAQVLGVRDLEEMLTMSPVEIFVNLSTQNLTTNQISSSVCVFWNHSEKSWSRSGVDTFLIVNNQVKCISQHLTSFAVLVSLYPSNETTTADRALSVISYLGCVISIVCLLATIICLILFRKILNKGPLLYVHLNLAVALLLGYLFFVVGVETARQVEALCIVLAALMQYFFLASFFWMLSEGIMLYLLIVRVFGNTSQRWYWFLLVGWGIPIPIVVISASVLRSDYISDNYCWLHSGLTSAAIWTFVVPMLLVILVNSVILIVTVANIVRGVKFGGAGTEVKTRTLVISAIQGAVILLPLLGITWVIGLFQVNNDTVVFAWIFVFLNSFQGAFIFILHVLRNSSLLRTIQVKCCKKKDVKATEVTTTVMLSSKKSSSLDYTGTTGPYSLSVAESLLERKDDLMLSQEVKSGSLGLRNGSNCSEST